MDDSTKSDLILEEIDRRGRKEKIVDVEEEKVKLVVFSLHMERYAFFGDDVKEILPLVRIYYVPGAPDFILGVINVRGDIESVVNINRFLGLPDSRHTQHSRIAIAARGEVRSGVLVDSIDDVMDVPKSAIRPPLSTLDSAVQEFVVGELTSGTGHITVLDIGGIFGKVIV